MADRHWTTILYALAYITRYWVFYGQWMIINNLLWFMLDYTSGVVMAWGDKWDYFNIPTRRDKRLLPLSRSPPQLTLNVFGSRTPAAADCAPARWLVDCSARCVPACWLVVAIRHGLSMQHNGKPLTDISFRRAYLHESVLPPSLPPAIA